MIVPYGDLEFANNFFKDFPKDDYWDGFTDEEKTGLLKNATLNIDTLNNLYFGYRGKKTNEDQNREFPRNVYGGIPENVKIACCLEALALGDKDKEQRRKLIKNGVTKITIGKVSESYGRFIGRKAGKTGNIIKIFDPYDYLSSYEAFRIMVLFLDRQGVCPIV